MKIKKSKPIRKQIRLFYIKKLPFPIIVLFLFAALFPTLSPQKILFPYHLSSNEKISESLYKNHPYVTIKADSLYRTGYRLVNNDKTTGYYYYSISKDNQCTLYLLDATLSNQEAQLEHITVTGKLVKDKSDYNAVVTSIASDINWTVNGLKSITTPYIISTPDYPLIQGNFLLILLGTAGLVPAISVLLYLIYISVPVLAPCCLRLRKYGSISKQLNQAEEELVSIPQVATEDIFLTPDYFIELSKYGIAVMPIKEIQQIYKHSTLHKIFGIKLSLSYTLHIVGNKKLQFDCPKNKKSDIDGIMDYLKEANPNIHLGFHKN